MNEKKIGRHFVLGFEGTTLPDSLKAFAARFDLGGVILFTRNCPDAAAVKALTAEVKTRLGPHVLVMVDQEGGRVERIKDSVERLPPAAVLALTGPDGVEESARRQSADLKALGIDVNLAPVCDVIRPRESGAIGDRAFSTDPEMVAFLAGAFHRGMVRGGIIGCAKHFPGHGASARDTHLGPGTIDLTLDELRRTDLVPFASLIEGGVPLVMACHLSYPAVDEKPACFSHKWITEILRKELGFKGAVITDDMEMGAAHSHGAPKDAALEAFNAGCDLLIYGRMLKPAADVVEIAEHLVRHADPALLAASAARLEGLAAKK